MYRYVKLSPRFRLLDVESFPEELRAAIRATADALVASGLQPSEYAARVSTRDDDTHYAGMLRVFVRNDACDAWPGSRGCPCGKCRTCVYDPQTGVVVRVWHIR